MSKSVALTSSFPEEFAAYPAKGDNFIPPTSGQIRVSVSDTELHHPTVDGSSLEGHVLETDTLESLLESGKSDDGKSLRPWGYYKVLHRGERFQVKCLSVNPGCQLSLQKHFHRAEHWVVVNGTALVTRDSEKILLSENESVYLPLGAVHRLENPGRIPLNLIEAQSGTYLEEDDIVRLEDVYGRIP